MKLATADQMLNFNLNDKQIFLQRDRQKRILKDRKHNAEGGKDGNKAGTFPPSVRHKACFIPRPRPYRSVIRAISACETG